MRQADIEIYVQCRDLAAILKWLETVFSAIEIEQSDGKRIAGSIQLDPNTGAADFLLLGKAAEDYSSVWFKQNLTPWDNDIDCGRAAFEALQREVRVSAGGWTEGDEDDLFLRINSDGESRFLWRTR